MAKGYKRRYWRSGGKDKYSVEQAAGTVSTNEAGNGGVVIVPPTTLQGMRKVKHLTIQMCNFTGLASDVLYWALVYVPQGTSASTIAIDSTSMYEPNQFVMGCGVFDFVGGPLRINCPLSRNLNSGDNISLIVFSTNGTAATAANYGYVVKYAITLQ